MSWISRNLLLIIGGFILLPISMFVSLMILAFGVGFSDEKLIASIPAIAFAFYLVVFIGCWRFAHLKFVRDSSYGYWDIAPIFYFVLVFFLLAIW
jgi:hypothetical protein